MRNCPLGQFARGQEDRFCQVVGSPPADGYRCRPRPSDRVVGRLLGNLYRGGKFPAQVGAGAWHRTDTGVLQDLW